MEALTQSSTQKRQVMTIKKREGKWVQIPRLPRCTKAVNGPVRCKKKTGTFPEKVGEQSIPNKSGAIEREIKKTTSKSRYKSTQRTSKHVIIKTPKAKVFEDGSGLPV